MLALITYKNLFPRDFADLQLGCGFMFEIIGGNGKERLTSSEQARLKEIIKIKNSELSNLQNEPFFSDEIAILYYSKLYYAMNKVSRYHDFQPSADPHTCKKNIEQFRGERQYNTIITEYDNRLKCSDEILAKKNARVSSIESEISKANRKLTEFKGSRIKDLINRGNIDDLFKAKFTSETGQEKKFTTLKDSPYFALLKYLVREGFIDETYSDYMTYFYENSLTRIDKIFLRSVTDKRAKEVNYMLDNPSMVVSRLPLAYFGQEEILNFA
jgi:hypothetical protein